jgi:hypothetical protein
VVAAAVQRDVITQLLVAQVAQAVEVKERDHQVVQVVVHRDKEVQLTLEAVAAAEAIPLTVTAVAEDLVSLL